MRAQKIHALALLGAALLGAAMGAQLGLEFTARLSLGVPFVLLGVLVMTTPALYITSAFSGVAPSAKIMLHEVGAILRDGGVILLGVAPALFFMGSTTLNPWVGYALGQLTLTVTALIAFGLLYQRLFQGAKGKRLPLFALWALVTLGIGHHLLSRLIA
ncbi:hypothetical protein KKF91_21100 [Myxococcota bacterium]|nr:hypothetical protein [Myxococcota bacterium]MBU1433042.1 hypothetical protein [Myxococcota bacterium]MBU1899923.1 hypothetical protein [Myxococcota bacterium]